VVGEDVTGEVLVAIAERSPGFIAWQDGQWLVHCGGGAAFLGRAGARELAGYPDALESLRQDIRTWGWPDNQIDDFLGSLNSDGHRLPLPVPDLRNAPRLRGLHVALRQPQPCLKRAAPPGWGWDGSGAVGQEAAFAVVGADEDESAAVAEVEEERTVPRFLAPVGELAQEPGIVVEAPRVAVGQYRGAAEEFFGT
jgi:hypothetical protein